MSGHCSSPDTTQTVAQLRKQLARQQAYVALAAQAAQTRSLEGLYEVISSHVPMVLGIPRASIALLDTETHSEQFQVIAFGGSGDITSTKQWLPLSQTAIEHACLTQQSVSTLEHGTDAFSDWQKLQRENGFSHFIISPLISRQKKTIGTFNIAYPPQRTMSPEDVVNAQAFAQVIASNLELHRLNGRLQKSLHDLELAQSRLVQHETVAALGNVVAGFAHELNTPLGVAVTATSLIREEILAAQAMVASRAVSRRALGTHFRNALDSLDITNDNLLRGVELVQELRAATFKEKQRSVEEIALGSFCQKIVEGLSLVLGRHNVKVRLHGDGGVVTTDVAALKGLLTNLIQNACIHGYGLPEDNDTQPRWVDITLDVSSPPDEPTVAIVVRDYGKGIPADIRDKVFEPFFTTRRGKGGSGLGLHLAYSHAFGSLKGSLQLLDVTPGTGFRCEFTGVTPPAQGQTA